MNELAPFPDGIPSVETSIEALAQGVTLVTVRGELDMATAELARGDARIRDDVLAALAEYSPGTSPWTVSVRDGVVALRGPADESTRKIADILARSVPGVTRVSIDESA